MFEYLVLSWLDCIERIGVWPCLKRLCHWGVGFEASKGFHNFRMLSATCSQTKMYALKRRSSYLPSCLHHGL